jgi:hypothetical protein
MTPRPLGLAFVLAASLASPAWAQGGPVILTGEDPDQILTPSIHCGGFGCDGLYGSLLRCLLRNATDPTPADPNDPPAILVIGSAPPVGPCTVGSGNPGESFCGVQQMIDAAATLPSNSCGDPVPQPIVDLVNDAEIDAVDFSPYTAIIVPSTSGESEFGVTGEGVEVRGGMVCSEIDRLAGRTGEDPADGTTMSIPTFVNKLGRGLMAFAERGEDPDPFSGRTQVTGCDNAFSFLPGCFSFGYPPGFDNVTETEALEDFGMELPVDGIDHRAYHTTWTGPVTRMENGLITEIAGLSVLARKEEDPERGEPVIIGGKHSVIRVCNAGGPYTTQCGNDVTVDLDGAGSVALGGVSWATDCAGATLSAADTLTPTLSMPGTASCQGACTVTLTVTDECGRTDTCSTPVTVGDTTPPQLEVPPPLLLECSAPGGVPLLDPAVQAWLASATAQDDCGAASISNDAPALFPAGCPPAGATTTVTFTATDGCGNQSQDTSTITVVDTLPPVIDRQPDLGEGGCGFLWPPMHGYADFSIDDTGTLAHDVCGGFSLTYSGCGSSQPEDRNGIGDGESKGDCVLAADLGRTSLRAERDGACSPLDRVYTMTLDATDACGNISTSAPFSLCVYHDQGHRPPKTGPVYQAQPDSNQNDVRPGWGGSYGSGCGGGCSLRCDPTQAQP